MRIIVAGSSRPAWTGGGLIQARPGSDTPDQPWTEGWPCSFVSSSTEAKQLVDELEPGAWGTGAGGLAELGDRRVQDLVHDRVRHRLDGGAGLGRGVGQPGKRALHLAGPDRLEPLAQRDDRGDHLDVAPADQELRDLALHERLGPVRL